MATRFSTAAVYAMLALISRGVGAPTSPDLGHVREFLDSHCTRCHGEEKQKGDFRVDDLTGNFAAEGSRWSVILEQIRDGEMPPKKERQPTEAQRKAVAGWIGAQMGGHAARKPNHGNLVPHELLFPPGAISGGGSGETGGVQPPAPRYWRLSPEGYLGWVEMVSRGSIKGIVQPFTANPERGIKDFATLGMVDEPTTDILLRNAETIVEKQTAHEIVEGRVRGKNDSVREFTDLMDPAQEPTPAQLEKAVRKQFQTAVARQPEAGEVQRFLALYEKCAKAGDRLGAARIMLAAVLLQAESVFRPELGGAEGMLTQREIAGALSAALMDKRDGKLFDAAEKGQLATREQIAAQTRRILDDPKTPKPRLLRFFREYFEYGNAPEVFKDRPKDLMHEPRQHVADTDRLVLHILAADRDVFRQLLTTPLAFVNAKSQTNKQTRQEELARSVTHNAQNNKGQAMIETLYGLQDWPADQPVTLAEGTRLGVLMQPSWLIAWSENFNNDIVRRGKFIRERLLGGTVPDLPIGVAAMVPNDRDRTFRVRVESVTRADACWKCHQRMDDLGLPFEQFDHYGRLVAEELILDPAATAANVDKKGRALGEVLRGVPVVSTGQIAGTGDAALDGPVRDARELVTRIANSDRARQVFIRHVFRFYLGRNESLADAPALREADRAYVQSGGSFKELLISLLTSDSFLRRAPVKVASASTPPAR